LSNQLKTLGHIDMFTTPAPDPATAGAFASPFGTAPLAERARVYLHTNCSQCHRTTRGPDLRFDTPEGATRLCDPPAVLVPGRPEASKIISLLRDPDPSVRMPRGAGNVIDEQGVKLIEDWIRAKTSCP
jgi:mono/diheme cytochrome c family protein